MDQTVTSVRTFNRFYTHRVGALNTRFLGTDLTLGEARMLLEIARAGRVLASDLRRLLDMDPAHVSRMLARFESRGWIVRHRDGTDGRARPLSLSPAGQAAFQAVDERQAEATRAMLADQDGWGRRDVAQSLALARLRLDPASGGAVAIRPFRAGDLGQIAARQALLYQQENGWGRGLEVAVLDAAAAFLRDFKPGREQCWVAELDGVAAGSVMLTDEGGGIARLRLLYVEPFARGRGIGGELIARCVAFARDCGYDRLTLWTHTVLDGARRLYARNGFRLTETAPHTVFGLPLQGETWVLDLTMPPA
ncbi:bifunctional helix-turn-helix transcriptional regulator/GNAT family N-acetyltransferase [Nguyenibacter vanlangensis]|uniref:Bifunctional helix-turn-helix transcriptional regulator/GNAT family N-acetyltransferase n=2 Tax=Nguyenibacter vanlangensis TaxID=1216886 RepID=A0ABZ3CZS7_9PROT